MFQQLVCWPWEHKVESSMCVWNQLMITYLLQSYSVYLSLFLSIVLGSGDLPGNGTGSDNLGKL